ncbi:hypothetical protein RIF29_29347 [Crotalaria pallida]|uniref:Pantoate--beta-alanine ligase n=1 Tax=Crotalaria pallida TaxID=3830 RepID=A0AAN9EFD4_CROPI
MAPKEPLVITDKDQMRKWSRAARSQGKVIGFVPTMGYLHEGHLFLVREVHKHVDVVVVSIYVNPGQFSPTEDLSTYPSDFDGDIQKLMSIPGGIDVVFHPYNLYDYGNDTKKNGGVGEVGEGSDDGAVHVFFRGVSTIVTKLFNIVEPDVAVFGKKDYQQWRVIQRMVRDLDFSIKVIGCEITHDNDGLAMSSCNVHLSPEESEKALSINKSLLRAKSAAEDGQVHCEKLRNLVIQSITEAGGIIDYAEIVDQESLEKVECIKGPVVFCVATWFGSVRLIDNIEIKLKMDVDGIFKNNEKLRAMLDELKVVLMKWSSRFGLIGSGGMKWSSMGWNGVSFIVWIV